MKKIKALCGIVLCGVMLSSNILFVCAEKSKNDEKVITVQWPGEGKDASPEIQKAVEQAEKGGGNATIAFETGKQYEVYPETAYHRMAERPRRAVVIKTEATAAASIGQIL